MPSPAAPSGKPLRSQAFEASQYSSNDEGLRLMSDNSPQSGSELKLQITMPNEGERTRVGLSHLDE